MRLFAKRKRRTTGFWELAGPHVKFLYNVALRYTGNRYDAEDLVQETFYTGLKNFEQLRDERKCKGWLFSILRNIYLRSLRLDGRMATTEYDDGVDYLTSLEEASRQEDIEKIYQRNIESEQIHRLLDMLPERYKSPLLLFYIEGMSYREISETMQTPLGTVMSRLARGREVLKKKVLRLYVKNSAQAKVVAFNKKR